MEKAQDKLTAQIQAAFRRVEDALRRRDPDTLAGRMGSPPRVPVRNATSTSTDKPKSNSKSVK